MDKANDVSGRVSHAFIHSIIDTVVRFADQAHPVMGSTPDSIQGPVVGVALNDEVLEV